MTTASIYTWPAVGPALPDDVREGLEHEVDQLIQLALSLPEYRARLAAVAPALGAQAAVVTAGCRR